MSLKAKAIGGAKWTTVSAVISAVVQLLQVAILAHFLDKKDFGLMALAVFVIGISQIFMDMGISNAIIYKKDVTHEQLSTMYWLNVSMGIFIYLLLFLLAPFVATFYHEPKLVGVLNWIALTFVIQPFGQQFETLLIKGLKFRALAIRDVFSKTVGLITGVLLAYYHFGVYSLVFANLLMAIVSTLLLVVIGLRFHKPGFFFSLKDLKEQGFLSFGLYQIGEKVINYFNAQCDTLIVGKLLGMDALGIYNVAKSLAYRPFQIINPIVTKVSFPILVKVQDDIPKLRAIYLKMVGFLTATNAPLYVGMSVLAKPLILLIFGDKWLEAVPILQILCVIGLVNSIGNPVGSLQLARGRADIGFYWNGAILLLLPLTAWVGQFWGLIGIASAIAIFKLMLILPGWKFFIAPLCNATLGEYLITFMKPVFFALIAGFVAYLSIFYISNFYLALIIGGGAGVSSYLLLNVFYGKVFLTDLKDFFITRTVKMV